MGQAVGEWVATAELWYAANCKETHVLKHTAPRAEGADFQWTHHFGRTSKTQWPDSEVKQNLRWWAAVTTLLNGVATLTPQNRENTRQRCRVGYSLGRKMDHEPSTDEETMSGLVSMEQFFGGCKNVLGLSREEIDSLRATAGEVHLRLRHANCRRSQSSSLIGFVINSAISMGVRCLLGPKTRRNLWVTVCRCERQEP